MHSADFASRWRGRLAIAGQGAWSVEVWIATKISDNYYISNSCRIFSSSPCWRASLLQSTNTLWHIIKVTNFYHVESPFSPVPSRNRSVPGIPLSLRWSAFLWRLDPSQRLVGCMRFSQFRGCIYSYRMASAKLNELSLTFVTVFTGCQFNHRNGSHLPSTNTIWILGGVQGPLTFFLCT